MKKSLLALTAMGVMFAGGATAIASNNNGIDNLFTEEKYAQTLAYFSQNHNLTDENMVGTRQAYYMLLKGEIYEVYSNENYYVLSEFPEFVDWKNTINATLETFEKLPSEGVEREQLIKEGYEKINTPVESLPFLQILNDIKSQTYVYEKDGTLFIHTF